MSKMIKRLMVVLLSALMFVGVVTTPVQAKGGKSRKPEPTPEPIAEPEPETPTDPVPEVSEEEPAVEETAEEINEEPADEVIVVEEATDDNYTFDEEDISTYAVLAANDQYSLRAVGDNPTVTTDNDLSLNKNVTPNGDGTYKITLSITGKVEQSSHTEVSSANVIVVLDVSTSMDESFGTDTRLAAVKSAANILVDAMPNAANVEMAVISFGGSVSTNVSWTTISSDSVKASIKNTITRLTTNRGTNWTDALTTAKNLADTKKNSGDTDPTFVIFLTDGCPTTNKSGHTHGSNGVQLITDTCISDPLNTMTAMVVAGYNVYGIYANETSEDTMPYSGSERNPSYTGDSDPLKYVIRVSGAAGYYNADSTDALEEVFTALARTITESIGYNNAEIEDGVTSMSNTSASTAVSGEATGFEYTKDGEPWADAPEAEMADGAVVWDLSEIGNLEEGVVYSVSFDVWPSQEAYDLIADLNNGKENYDELEDWQKAQIGGTGPSSYYLRTNTYLTSSYSHSGTDYTYNGDKGNNYMALAAEKISLKKLWPENMLDEYGAATYRDENGEEKTATEISLTITKDGADYLDVKVDSEHSWTKDDVYVSCGLMTVKDGVVEIKETGHDYTITEPASFSYYWDLIAETYHPMVINGVATLLVLDEDITTADNENTFQIGTKFYRKGTAAENTLEASNYRRSNLNLTKAIPDGAQNDFFTFTATVKDANSTDGYVWFSAWDPENGATVKDIDWVVSGATAQADSTGYWYATNGATVTFKIKAGWNVRFLNLYHGSTFSFEETAMSNYFEFDKAEATAKNGFMDSEIGTSWYEISGKNADGTIVEPNNQYTVTYTNKIAPYFYVYHSSDNTIEKIAISDSRVVNGKFNIVEETKDKFLYGGYYKSYAPETMTDSDIIALTYTEKSNGDYTYGTGHNEKGIWSTGSNAPYTGDKATAWNSKNGNVYTEYGKAMTPSAGTVYYLKEVPNGYLRPYVQVVYDTRANNTIKKLYLITATDDANYQEAGQYYNSTEYKNSDNGKLSATLKITNYDNTVNTILTAKNVFKGKVYDDQTITIPRGYLASVNLTSVFNTLSENVSFTMQPYFKTFDGVKVYGITTRTVNVGDKTYNNGETSINTSDVNNTAIYE